VLTPARDEDGWFVQHRPISAHSESQRLRDTLAAMEVSMASGLSPSNRRTREASKYAQIRAKYGIKSLKSPRSGNPGARRTIMSAPAQRSPSNNANLLNRTASLGVIQEQRVEHTSTVQMDASSAAAAATAAAEDDARVESIEAMSSAAHALLKSVNEGPRINLVPTGISSHTREVASYQDPHRESWTRSNYKQAQLMRRGALNSSINSGTAEALKRRQNALHGALLRVLVIDEEQPEPRTQSAPSSRLQARSHLQTQKIPRQINTQKSPGQDFTLKSPGRSNEDDSLLSSWDEDASEFEELPNKHQMPQTPQTPVMRASGGFSMDCGSKAYAKQSPAVEPAKNPRELLYSKQMAVQHERQRELPSRSFVRGPGSLQVVASGFQLAGRKYEPA